MMQTSHSTTDHGALLADSLIAVALLVSGMLLLTAGRILTDTEHRRELSAATRLGELSRWRLNEYEEGFNGQASQ